MGSWVRRRVCSAIELGSTTPDVSFWRYFARSDAACSRQDLLLEEISQRSSLIVVSVEYRLAPEHPFPAASEDCYEVADWLAANSRKLVSSNLWGEDLSFV